MARKRMFSLDVVYTDKFISLPLPAQALYFHLGMQGDDDGFVSAPKLIMRGIGTTADDLAALESAGFVICFPSGVLVITDWKINNDLKNDRYKETACIAEMQQLDCINKRYVSKLDTACIQNGDSTEHSIVEHNRTKHRETNTRARDVFAEFAGDDSELLKALRDFEDMRKKVKNPLTDRAKQLAVNKLQSYDRSEWIPMLNQSTLNGWKGIFPLKEKEKESGSNLFQQIVEDGEA